MHSVHCIPQCAALQWSHCLTDFQMNQNKTICLGASFCPRSIKCSGWLSIVTVGCSRHVAAMSLNGMERCCCQSRRSTHRRSSALVLLDGAIICYLCSIKWRGRFYRCWCAAIEDLIFLQSVVKFVVYINKWKLGPSDSPVVRSGSGKIVFVPAQVAPNCFKGEFWFWRRDRFTRYNRTVPLIYLKSMESCLKLQRNSKSLLNLNNTPQR